MTWVSTAAEIWPINHKHMSLPSSRREIRWRVWSADFGRPNWYPHSIPSLPLLDKTKISHCNKALLPKYTQIELLLPLSVFLFFANVNTTTQSLTIQGVVDVIYHDHKTADLWIIELIIRLRQVRFQWMVLCFYDADKNRPSNQDRHHITAKTVSQSLMHVYIWFAKMRRNFLCLTSHRKICINCSNLLSFL